MVFREIGPSISVRICAGCGVRIGREVVSEMFNLPAINNFIEQLQLNGKTYKLEDLYLHLNKAMGSTDAKIPDEMPAGVFVRFAEEDSLRMDIRSGEAEMTVRR